METVGNRFLPRYSWACASGVGVGRRAVSDPTVILDEPASSLDPEGIHWIRDVLSTSPAGRGAVSSHLQSEMALIARDLVVIGRAPAQECSVDDFVARCAEHWVAPEPGGRRRRCRQSAGSTSSGSTTHAQLRARTCAQVGETRPSRSSHELSPQSGSLEVAFLPPAGAEYGASPCRHRRRSPRRSVARMIDTLAATDRAAHGTDERWV
jgi:ABC-2 type transport system ATP-binding protein